MNLEQSMAGEPKSPKRKWTPVAEDRSLAERTTHERTIKTAAMETFAQHLAAGAERAEAYRAAYPSTENQTDRTVRANAYKASKHAWIIKRVRELRDSAALRTGVTADRLLLEMARGALFDPRRLFDEEGNSIPIHKLDDDAAGCVQGVEIEDVWRNVRGKKQHVGVRYIYRFVSKSEAQDKLARFLGLYERDNAQLSNPIRTMLDTLRGNVVRPVPIAPEVIDMVDPAEDGED